MENRPEYVATWLGLSRIGCVVPLINHNLKKQSLQHSIVIANSNALIFCKNLKDCKYIIGVCHAIFSDFSYLTNFVLF
jgi:acyl-coenzyme A synthetase/AMP-(fatty) acid ligase